MKKKDIPTYLASSIYDLPLSFYKDNGIEVVFSDLDNTLDTYDTVEPSQRTYDLINSLKEQGIAFYIISNNTGERVKTYAKDLGVEAACWMLKPFSFRLKSFIKKKGFDPKKILLVGDQIQTDVKAGNGARIRTMLVTPLSEKDPPYTHWNRQFDTPKRNEIDRKGLAPWVTPKKEK